MPVSPLRQQMLDALQLRGYSPKTVKSYIHSVHFLSRHYQRSPDQISPAEVQAWLAWFYAHPSF